MDGWKYYYSCNMCPSKDQILLDHSVNLPYNPQTIEIRSIKSTLE